MGSHETCRIFLDQWDEISFRDPAAGRAHALEGLRRVECLRNPPTLRARALTIYGSSLRGTDPEGAVKTLGEALCIYRDEIDERIDQSDAYRRLGIALASLPDPSRDEALFALDTAFKISDSLGDGELAARVQMEIGKVKGEMGDHVAAFEKFIAAAPLLDGVFLNAVLHNTQAIMVMAKRAGRAIPSALRRRGLEQLRLARMTKASRDRWGKIAPNRQASYGRPKLTEADAAARWTIGLLLDDERQRDAAIHQLKSALKDFITLGFKVKAVALSLDLAEIYAKIGRWRSVSTVARRARSFVDSPQLAEVFDLLILSARGKEFDDFRVCANACRAALDR